MTQLAWVNITMHTWPIFDVWWAIFKQGGFLRFCIDNNPRLYNKGLKLNILYLFYFNLGEDQNLGELFLSWKSPGETNPALLKLCHTNDFKANSLWTGVPIFREILNLWILSDILKVECAVSVNSAFVNLIVLFVHKK